MRPHATRFLALTAAAATTALVAAGCASSNSSSSTASGAPITIGTSLSLTGDFSDDGLAFKRGYELWAADINKQGGLLGHPVKLKILNDNSDPGTVTTNYTQLIGTDHVAFVFGPFSSLLTAPSAQVAARYHYAFPEGAGGAPSVFALKLPNLFAVSPPVADQLVPLANWVASLPPSQRPKTAAYPMVDDPFADPMVQTAQGILQKAGVKTVYSKIFPAEAAQLKAGADQVARLKPDLVLLGTVDVPSVSAFMNAFMQQHYTPKILGAAAGPDQGANFLSAVGGSKNATGTFVPNGWYAGYPTSMSKAFVDGYIAKYGGTPSEINADAAEAYAVGQTLATAVHGTQSLNNGKVIAYLHTPSTTVQTVEGPAKFNAIGMNTDAAIFVFQWQKGGNYVQVLPEGANGSVAVVNPKPTWGQG